MEQTSLTIAQVVESTVKSIAIVGGFTTALSLGITQFSKQFTSNPKKISLFALFFGFLAGITLMHLSGNGWFSPQSLLVAAVAAIGAPGLYSVTTTLTGKKNT